MDPAAFWNMLRELLTNSSLTNAVSKIAAAASVGVDGLASLIYIEVYDWAKPQIEAARLRASFEQITRTLENMQGPDAAYALSFCRAIHALSNTDETRSQMMLIINAQWKRDSHYTIDQLSSAQKAWIEKYMPSLLPGAKPDQQSQNCQD